LAPGKGIEDQWHGPPLEITFGVKEKNRRGKSSWRADKKSIDRAVASQKISRGEI